MTEDEIKNKRNDLKNQMQKSKRKYTVHTPMPVVVKIKKRKQICTVLTTTPNMEVLKEKTERK